MNLLQLRNVDKIVGSGESQTQILFDINLTINQGEFVAIIGQSGSGKSTLMNILGCLDVPSNGSYEVHDQSTTDMDADELAALRRETFGFIFQRYNLLSSLSALENVALPSVYQGVSQEERNQRAKELLTSLGLEKKMKNRPSQLSGGQQQRVSIARALMNGGEILLADEPTGALDSASGKQVMGILQKLHKEGHTIILVTHDRQVASYAHRIIEIQDGKIVLDTVNEDTILTTYRANKVQSKASFFSRRKLQFTESFRMALHAMLSQKMRSLLTMLGIIIGIASVVTVIAAGNGSQEKILSEINAMGTNTITINPGTGFGDRTASRIKTLTVEDGEVLAQQSYIDGVTPQSNSSGLLAYENLSLNSQVQGVGELFFSVKGLKLDSGRFFTKDEVTENASVAVIDQNVKNKLFPNGEDPVGKIILFKKRPLEIIGVTQAQDSGFGGNSSLTLWVPYSTVMSKLSGAKSISSLTVLINEKASFPLAEKNITTLLQSRHGGIKDFFTMNSDTIKKTIESTSSTMTLLISCIACISLVVGGIGVMNIMLVSVTERTREIGVRMAIGARQGNILEQFLLEAILLCVLGGTLGVLASFGIGQVFSYFSTSFALSYSTASIVLALACSSCIGIVFGFFPARNAARLNPIEALSQD